MVSAGKVSALVSVTSLISVSPCCHGATQRRLRRDLLHRATNSTSRQRQNQRLFTRHFDWSKFLGVRGSVIQKMARRCRVICPCSLQNALRWRLNTRPILATRWWRAAREGGCCHSRINHRVRLSDTKNIGQNVIRSFRYIKACLAPPYV